MPLISVKKRKSNETHAVVSSKSCRSFNGRIAFLLGNQSIVKYSRRQRKKGSNANAENAAEEGKSWLVVSLYYFISKVIEVAEEFTQRGLEKTVSKY